MVSVFPTHCWEFFANQDIPKGKKASPAPASGLDLVMTAPIQIKKEDSLIIDIRTGRVEVIKRNGIAVYRDAWKN